MDPQLSSLGLPPRAESSTLPHMRRRARKACLPCRQRKRKCDVQYPCTMCTTYGYECKYSDDKVSKASASSASPGNYQPASKRVKHDHGTNDDYDDGGTEPVTEQGILDPFKSRYVSQNSAIAFPRSLGLDLHSKAPPPLHSFAWNCGVRPEEAPSTHARLLDLVTYDEFQRFSEVFFQTVHPIFGVLDKFLFLQQCNKFWKGPTQDLVLGAVIGGVVALGSFFSFRAGHPKESDIVKYVKGVLEDPDVTRNPSMDQINASIFRTLYLRSTTRPHVAWLTSCVSLHLAEATGLHHEAQSIILTTDHSQQLIHQDDEGKERARRTFWVAWALNSIMSYEYGRSKRSFGSISCRPLMVVEGDTSAHHVALAQLIPRDNPPSDAAARDDLQRAIKSIRSNPNENRFMSLSRADVCFCFYRRLRLLKQGIDKEIVSCILRIGEEAVEAACEFAEKGIPWWNILNTTFQFFCVLLAIDTSDSLAKVSWVLDRFKVIVEILGTHLALEALDTAKVLLRDSMAKKRQELAFLEVADGATMPPEREIDINWDALLNPEYSEVLQDFSLY
ncbi:hypothetical protein BP5796_02281 [Coleophoma crateriformis]|uniref:Zn(2)-C6 fungal-type domain-containing protein n=1 Tax=Coleophoma crateriformis TaxID=565419 RepID=A0A3D8SXT4_9HELO|nr:hypothetical protein BP5796_02281 [Coleophoma crateriformis]